MADIPETGNWLELPRDVSVAIISRLGIIDILESVQKVCTLWRDICKEPSIWRSIDFQNLGHLWDEYDLKKMCMHAVDLSKGELQYINIKQFGTDQLLACITERSSHLRRLRLVSCLGISDKGLIEAAPKLTLLEELEISYCSFSAAALVVVGGCCPRLKSFKFNNRIHQGYMLDQNDWDAQAIAENMRELRHLQLFGNKLTNCGLVAILDGCPHLESLDLRCCHNITLRGDLEKRCGEQIKHLQRPNDSIDHEFYEAYHKYFFSDEDDYEYYCCDYDNFFEEDYFGFD